MKRVKSFFKGYMRAIEINAALMYLSLIHI